MQTLYIHPDNPQPRLIKQVIDTLNHDGLIVLPTNTGYVLACTLTAKNAFQKLKQLFCIDDKYIFTLLCHNISQAATYTIIENNQYHLLKTHTPSPITFVLNATNASKKFISKKKVIGIQIFHTPITLSLLQSLDNPMIIHPISPSQNITFDNPDDIEKYMGHHADMMIHTGFITPQTSTVVDITNTPTIIKQGDINVSDWAS